MSFIVSCPKCNEDRLGSFQTSSYWLKHINNLCDKCRPEYEKEEAKINKELNEAREYIRNIRNVP
jgi:hypothetical protein